MTAAEGRALGAPRTPGSAGVPASTQDRQTGANTGAGAELETARRLHQTTEQRSGSVSSSSSSSSTRRPPPSLGLGVWARHTEAPARSWLGEREIQGPSGPPDLEPALGTAPSSRDRPEEQGHGVARRNPVPPCPPPPHSRPPRGRPSLEEETFHLGLICITNTLYRLLKATPSAEPESRPEAWPWRIFSLSPPTWAPSRSWRRCAAASAAHAGAPHAEQQRGAGSN